MKAFLRLTSVVVLCIGCLIDSTAMGAEPSISELKARAERGDDKAQAALGLKYCQGSGVEKDYATALQWYQKAEEKTNFVALFSLALMHENGQGTARNPAEALKWYQKAADHGYEVAQRRLAGMYAQGRIVNKDPAEAFKWMHRAADHGDPYDQLLLARYYANGQGTPKDLVEAYALFTAAAGKWPEARTNLARIVPLMTPDQLAKAKQRVLELEKRSGK